jgi:hypothetical protein
VTASTDQKIKHAVQHMSERGAISREVRFTTSRNSDGTTITKCSKCGKEIR